MEVMQEDSKYFKLKTFTKTLVPKSGYVLRIVGTNLYLVMYDLKTYNVLFEPTIVGWLLYEKKQAHELAEWIKVYFDAEVVEYEKAFNEHASEKIQMKLN